MKYLLIIFSLLITSISWSDDAEHSFWSNVDKFLGEITDGVSKKDAITGLRTFERRYL